MDIFSYSPQQKNNTDFTWNQKENILLGLSITLLLADIILAGGFVYKVFIKNNHQVFGNTKITPTLDKVFMFALILLFLQTVVDLKIVLIFKNVKSGLTCSIYNAVFNILNSLIKTLTPFTIFFHYYIWIKQNCLGFLHLNAAHHSIFKLVFAFILSVALVVSFKMNIDTIFIVINGICYGKGLPFRRKLSFISLIASFLVIVCLITLQCYYIFKTKQTENKHKPNEKNKLVFEIIRRQIYLFLKLHVAIALSLSVYFVKKISFQSNGMINFAGVGYLISCLYNFLSCTMVCVFRLKVPKVDVKSEFLMTANKKPSKS